MSGTASVRRDTAWLLAGRLLGQGLLVIVTVLLAARLGLVGLGEYAFIGAVVALANVVTTFGTDMVLIREIAGGGRVDRWPAALAVQLGLSAAAIVLIWLGAPLVPGQRPVAVAAVRLLSLSLIPAALFSVCSAALRGADRMSWYAAGGVAAAALQLGAVWVFVPAGADVGVAATVLVAVQSAVAVFTWTLCAAGIPGFRRPGLVARADIVEMARTSASIGALGLLGALYQRTGVIALSTFVGPAATGWFAGASRIAEASKIGHVALFGALYPRMAEAHAGTAAEARGRTQAADGFGRSWRLSIALAGAISAGLLLLGPLLIGGLYGPAFAPAAGGLAILALSVVPSTMATYQSLALLAAHREATTLRVLLISLIALGGLLALLLPIAGWIGACWAVLGAETVQAGLMLGAGSRFPTAVAGRLTVKPAGTRRVHGGRELPELP